MNEPKKRGRPAKAKPCAECGQEQGHYDDCSVGLGATAAAFGAATVIVDPAPTPLMELAKAQAYAMRVWNGQSITAPRPWRIERVKAALEGQGLSFDGVVLPDGDFFADLDREREENRK